MPDSSGVDDRPLVRHGDAGAREQGRRRALRLGPKLGFVGVSVEYRLAPETPYPGPLEDCYRGLRWTFEHAAELGGLSLSTRMCQQHESPLNTTRDTLLLLGLAEGWKPR